MTTDSNFGGTETVLSVLRRAVSMLLEPGTQFTIEARQTGAVTVLAVKVAPNGAGQLIGRAGQTARALRTVIGAIGMKDKSRYTIDIDGHGEGEQPLAPGCHGPQRHFS